MALISSSSIYYNWWENCIFYDMSCLVNLQRVFSAPLHGSLKLWWWGGDEDVDVVMLIGSVAPPRFICDRCVFFGKKKISRSLRMGDATKIGWVRARKKRSHCCLCHRCQFTWKKSILAPMMHFPGKKAVSPTKIYLSTNFFRDILLWKKRGKAVAVCASYAGGNKDKWCLSYWEKSSSSSKVRGAHFEKKKKKKKRRTQKKKERKEQEQGQFQWLIILVCRLYMRTTIRIPVERGQA